MKTSKMFTVLLLVVTVAFGVAGCKKDSRTNGQSYTYTTPKDTNMKLKASEGLDLKVDSYETKDTKIELEPIGEIKLELADNITAYEMEADIPQEKLELALEKRNSLLLELKNEFKTKGIKIAVDEKNGDIAMDASVLFDKNESGVSEEGKKFLSEFLEVYTSVIFDQKYEDFVSQIVVEGHTDTDGTYDYNMKLSQDRADNVKKFCMSDESNISDKYTKKFNSILVSKGYSYDRPVKDKNGKTDMAASRRVSFRFMINLK